MLGISRLAEELLASHNASVLHIVVRRIDKME